MNSLELEVEKHPRTYRKSIFIKRYNEMVLGGHRGYQNAPRALRSLGPAVWDSNKAILADPLFSPGSCYCLHWLGKRIFIKCPIFYSHRYLWIPYRMGMLALRNSLFKSSNASLESRVRTMYTLCTHLPGLLLVENESLSWQEADLVSLSTPSFLRESGRIAGISAIKVCALQCPFHRHRQWVWSLLLRVHVDLIHFQECLCFSGKSRGTTCFSSCDGSNNWATNCALDKSVPGQGSISILTQ